MRKMRNAAPGRELSARRRKVARLSDRLAFIAANTTLQGCSSKGALGTSPSARRAFDAASDVSFESTVDLVPMIRPKVGKVGLSTPRLFAGEEANISNL
jgi:hypothetical protein